MENQKKGNMILGVLFVFIVLLISIFGINLYNEYQSNNKKRNSNIEVSVAKNPENENQLLVTVQVKGDSSEITGYSFDGGKTWQVSNRYIATDNSKLDIRIKDYKGNIVGKTDYEVTTVDFDGPVLTVTLPSEVLQGSTIQLLSYVKATDPSGLKGEIKATPSTLDTKTLGKKQIVYEAVDNFGNFSSVTVEVNVVASMSSNNSSPSQTPFPTPNPGSSNNSGNTGNSGNSGSSGNTGNNGNSGNSGNNGNNNSSQPKQTQYRYRVKTISKYECNYFECSYIDYSDTTSPTVSFPTSSPCCTGNGCTALNPMINYPCPPGRYCPQVMVPAYKASGNICYAQGAIYINKNPQSNSSTGGTVCNGKYCVIQGTPINPNDYVPKENCDSNEIKLNGYCYKINSKGSYICPNDYVLENDTCAKKKKKTCSDICTSESWGPWSEWSTTKVIATNTVEVQTR